MSTGSNIEAHLSAHQFSGPRAREAKEEVGQNRVRAQEALLIFFFFSSLFSFLTPKIQSFISNLNSNLVANWSLDYSA
jgi:hypothetical protein